MTGKVFRPEKTIKFVIGQEGQESLSNSAAVDIEAAPDP
jgi:hypothetical protein